MGIGRYGIVPALIGSMLASECTRTVTQRAARFDVAGDAWQEKRR